MPSNSLGKKFEVKRKSESEVTIKLPSGMNFTSEKLSIEDIIEAVNNHSTYINGEISAKSTEKDGNKVTLRCCSGNTAIAVVS